MVEHKQAFFDPKVVSSNPATTSVLLLKYLILRKGSKTASYTLGYYTQPDSHYIRYTAASVLMSTH